MRVDLTNDRPEDLDQLRLPAGWYLTSCVAYEKGQQHEEIIWRFRVDSELFRGSVIESKLNNPELAMDARDTKGQWRKLKLWLRRLGVIKDGDTGKIVDLDFAQCVNQKYVIQLEDNWYTAKSGAEVNYPRPAYAGVYPLDHPEIPAVERIRLGLPPLPGQAAPSAGSADGEKPKRGRKPPAPQSPSLPASPGAPAFDPAEI